MIFNPLSGHFIIKKASKKTKVIVPLVPEPGRRPKGGEEDDTKCVFEEVIFIPTAIGISLRKSRRQRLQQMV